MSSMVGATGAATGLKGTGYKQINIPNKTNAQLQIFNQLMQGASPGIQQGLSNLSQQAGGANEEFWRQQEAPAFRQLGELQGGISSRFSGMGTGARRSSGFQNVQAGAATDLAERLQSNRMNLQQQAIRDLLGIGQNLLGADLNTSMLIPKKKPWWQSLLSDLAGYAGQQGSQFASLSAAKAAGLL